MAASLAMLAASLWLLVPKPATQRLISKTSSNGNLGLWPFVLGLFGLAMLTSYKFLAVSSTVIALTVTWFIRHHLKAAETTARIKATRDFLNAVVGDLQAGNVLSSALRSGSEFALPSAPATFQQVLQQIGHAPDLRTVQGILDEHRADCPELLRASAPWLVAEEHGVSLVHLMTHSHDHLQQQLSHRQSTDAALQGPRATSVILSLLPGAGLLMGAAMGAKPLHFLTSTSLGGGMLLLGSLLVCGGFVWSQIIIDGATR